MSPPLIAFALWIVAGAATAFLPFRRQFLPGGALLLAAPVLIAWLGVAHGWPLVAAGVFALVSMYRRPLLHLAARAGGGT